jgi:hypothetical protein
MSELDAVVNEINAQITNLQEHLGTGAAKDYAEYQSICGKISGLFTVYRYIKDLKQHMENSDE